jgi:hydroxyacylglutathione hydrolase
MIKVEKYIVNPLQENTWLVYDDSLECIIIDAGFHYRDEKEEIVSVIAENNLKPVKLINTHCHFDHMLGVEFLRDQYNIPFLVHESDLFWVEKAVEQGEFFGFNMNPVSPPDGFIKAGEPLKFGNSSLDVIHVPGHSPGHVVFHAADDKFIIAGDVLFYGSIGRTDLPGGDYRTLITSINEKLFVLPDETIVYCGHGPETTIGFEKMNNPFMK